MKRAPKWLKNISIIVSALVGGIFYGEGLRTTDDTLIYSGVALIMIALVSGLFVKGLHTDE